MKKPCRKRASQASEVESDSDTAAMARLECAREVLFLQVLKGGISDEEARAMEVTDAGRIDDELKVARILLLRALNEKAFDQNSIVTLDVQERLLDRITTLTLTQALIEPAPEGSRRRLRLTSLTAAVA